MITYSKVKTQLIDRLQNDPYHKIAKVVTYKEECKRPKRFDVINYLLSTFEGQTTNYLEIGVRNPDSNFNKITASCKYSVDPGVEFEKNPVDFNLTSDSFFHQLSHGGVLSKDIRFNVIFIDGLHLAEQVDRDIVNALKYITNDGFIVLHDCNPPTEWHAREQYAYHYSPAEEYWNGTTWKAFLKWRMMDDINSCCVDTDWGVGILSKMINLGDTTKTNNSFFEFKTLDENRVDSLNLISFDELKTFIGE